MILPKSCDITALSLDDPGRQGFVANQSIFETEWPHL